MTATEPRSIVQGWNEQLKALPLAQVQEFRAMLETTLVALNNLLIGDPVPFVALLSRADDVTVVGGFGGYERGWQRVKANAESAASRFADGRLIDVELVTLGASASGDLAFTVWIERAEVSMAGHKAHALTVRVTHIFRREDGAWRLIHRHGDQVVEGSQIVTPT
jgi:ketosteroid isomerase-like protein